ncbi:MAG: amidohydrolase [Anaerolineae bacterium]
MRIHILTNGRIYTGMPGHPWAEVMAIADGKVIALDQAALAWREAPDVMVEDLNRAFIMPSISDAHIHLMWYARGLRELDLRDCSRAELVERVQRRADTLSPGEWITGRGWDQNIWDDTSFPTATELDHAAPHHPVALRAKNGHALVANTAAIRAAGVDSQTPDPVHGKILRDERGEPTGIFLESAIGLISQAKPAPSLDTLVDLLDEAQDHLLAFGITSVHDVDGPPAFEAMQELKRQGRLRIRIVKYIRREVLDAAIEAGLRSGFGDDKLRLGGLKLYADGALGARTAAMFAPYEQEPDNVGLLTLDPEELHDLARRAASHGLQMAIHAIGDRANKLVVDALSSVREIAPALRHRVEHVQLIAPEDQRRLAHNGFIASMQPTHAVHDMRMADRYWGKRSQNAYAWRSIQEAGATLAFGSDAPIEVFDPFLGLYAAVTRRSETNGDPGPEGWYPEQRLTLTEALRAFTWGAAYAAGMEKRLGLLVPGYYADLAVLDRDIFSVPPEDLLKVKVRGVMVAGEWQDTDT